MLETLVAAVVTCGLSALVGQAIMTLCGARAWSPIAAPVGLSAAIAVAVTAPRIPGRASTTAALLVLVVLAAVVVLVRHRVRPPLWVLVCGLPPFLLAILPFVASGHFGTLGASVNNDMAPHLALAEAYQSGRVAEVTGFPVGYPAGAHAFAAAVGQILGIRIDMAFAGLAVATVAMLGWAAGGLATRATIGGRAVFATIVAMPFLVAGYHGQGSFKELLQILFVLGVAVHLTDRDPATGRLRWVPMALLLAGTVSVYSIYGLAWPLLILGGWLIARAAVELLRRPAHEVVAELRAAAAPVLIGAGAFVAILVPQARRVLDFRQSTDDSSTLVPLDNLGNLVGRLWSQTALGVWDSPDYRFAPVDAFHQGIWSGVVLVLVAGGVVWWLRRGSFVVPIAAAGAALIWWYSDRTQSPYLSAKGLLILSPFLVAIVLLPWVEEAARLRRRAWWAVGPALVAALFAFKAGESSIDALRFAKVASTADVDELRAVQPLFAKSDRVLFLGNSDYTLWYLAGTRVQAPVVGYVVVPTRPERPWQFGQNYDIDSLDAATINTYNWVVTPRDALGSEMPEGLKLVRSTDRFDVYRRLAPVLPRGVFAEDDSGTGVLRCSTPTGRAVVRQGGVAGIATPRVVAAGPTLRAGDTGLVELRLPRGTWDIVASYFSPFASTWSAPGMKAAELPAYLDRPGPRWPVGRVSVERPTTVPLTVEVDDPLLASSDNTMVVSGVGAAKVQPQRIVPIQAACGRRIDWFQPGRVADG